MSQDKTYVRESYHPNKRADDAVTNCAYESVSGSEVLAEIRQRSNDHFVHLYGNDVRDGYIVLDPVERQVVADRLLRAMAKPLALGSKKAQEFREKVTKPWTVEGERPRWRGRQIIATEETVPGPPLPRERYYQKKVARAVRDLGQLVKSLGGVKIYAIEDLQEALPELFYVEKIKDVLG